jgi:AmpD protein
LKPDFLGWLSGVQRVVSPNHDARPPHTPIKLLVIHNISLPPNEYGGNAIKRFFTNTLDHSEHSYYEQLEGVRVSSHFLVRRDGQVVQFVPCNKRAWHAGVSIWRGSTRCNDFSIGIELEGSDFEPFTERQYIALVRLTRRLKRAYPIRDIAGHSDIAPGRKTDPGPYFDWNDYLQQLRWSVASTSPSPENSSVTQKNI